MAMKLLITKSFIKLWDSIFRKYPWAEAFCLSIIFHIIFLNFVWFCCQIHVMIFPNKVSEKIIEIEFLK